MLKVIRMLTTIGFVLNQIKKELVGGEKHGQFKICYVMNLTLNLIYLLHIQ
jgi:hypothetical protein